MATERGCYERAGDGKYMAFHTPPTGTARPALGLSKKALHTQQLRGHAMLYKSKLRATSCQLPWS